MEFPIVIFDGDCGLCNRSVNFIIRHEKAETLRFAPGNSEIARELMGARGLATDGLQSIILIHLGKYYTESGAVVEVARFLKWPWSMVSWFRVVPRPVRDWCYRRVADNRMKFGNADRVCDIADERIRQRIIES